MNKEIKVFVVILFLTLFFASFVSAFSFSQFWNKITGKATEGTANCTDSDGGINIYIKGHTLGYQPQAAEGHKNADVWDVCASDNSLYEYGCTPEGYFDSGRYNCSNGCSDGACINESNIVSQTIITSNNQTNFVSSSYCPDVIILKENKKNEFLWEPNSEKNKEDHSIINHTSAIESLSEICKENFDFLIFMPQTFVNTNYHLKLIQNITGIGWDEKYYDPSVYPSSSQIYPNLKFVVVLDAYFGYHYYSSLDNENYPNKDSLLEESIFPEVWVIYHEIEHYWAIFNLKGITSSLNSKDTVFGVLTAHWPNNLNLFNLSLQNIDPLQYFSWGMNEEGVNSCGDLNNLKKIENVKYSNLTLYLMGLIPLENVTPVYVYNFKKTDNERYNIFGPSCEDEFILLNITKVTIQEIVEKNGPRIPSYSQSQKSFKTAFVVLVPYNQSEDEGFITYIKKIKNSFISSWSRVATKESYVIFPSGNKSTDCISKSCSDLNKVCGVFDDGCNGYVNCGECLIDNPECTSSCANPSEINCGEIIEDGCGETCEIGTKCDSGQTCLNNQCIVSSCQGCLLDEKCYPLGYRKNETFCSENYKFNSQLKEDSSCKNNFECTSNLCVGDKCISDSLINKIIAFFKKLFGIK